jgi:hypothetical protein
MNISTFMEMGQRGASMDNRFNRIWNRDLTIGGSVDQVEQGWAMQIFLNEKLATVMGSLPKDVHNIRMGQTPQQPGFAPQAPDLFCVGPKDWQEDLTRKGTNIRRAPDLVQFGNTPSTQVPDHGKVAPNAGAKLKGETGRKTDSPSG